MESNLLASNGVLQGTLCCWSAAAANGLSGSYDWNWSFYADVARPIRAKNLTLFPTPPGEIETVKIGRVTATAPLQTIIDLVRWDCEVEFIFQAMSWWEYAHGSLDSVMAELFKQGLLSKYEQEYAVLRDGWVDIY